MPVAATDRSSTASPATSHATDPGDAPLETSVLADLAKANLVKALNAVGPCPCLRRGSPSVCLPGQRSLTNALEIPRSPAQRRSSSTRRSPGRSRWLQKSRSSRWAHSSFSLSQHNRRGGSPFPFSQHQAVDKMFWLEPGPLTASTKNIVWMCRPRIAWMKLIACERARRDIAE